VFIKVTHSGPRRYVQLVEAYRDAAGRPKQRTLATLGRLDQLSTELESVISGLLRVTGKSPAPPASLAAPSFDPAPTVSFESARDFGDVWALTELWNSLGFDDLRRVFRRTRHSIDVEALIRIMVLNRLCDPESKTWLRPRPSGISICCAPWTLWAIIKRRWMRCWPPCCARWWIRTWRWCSTT